MLIGTSLYLRTQRLFLSVRLSIGLSVVLSVGPSVDWSIGHARVERAFMMLQLLLSVCESACGVGESVVEG